jgi:hypothetical protein
MKNKGLLGLITIVLAGGSVLAAGDVPRLLPARILVPDPSNQNGVRQVSESATFHNHERFRLEVQPGQSGHIYLFCRNSQGEFQLLFPLRDDGDSYVPAGVHLNLPGDGWFRFDEVPGKEDLILVQSPQPLADLEDAINSGDTIDPSILDRYQQWTGKGIDRDGHAPQGFLTRHILLEHEKK